ncbi:MAG: hypothetical protein HRU20_04725 [Pseudomonadales bacterium]|nr:hypothetical protein [Pseudomonadales bacterium]
MLATYRQVFIVLQVFYILGFILVLSHSPLGIRRFIHFTQIGFIALICFWIFLYQTEASHKALIWFAEPLFAIHMRDIGNIAAVLCTSILVLLISHIYSGRFSGLLLSLSFVICWAFLLWTGGRMAIIAVVLTSLMFYRLPVFIW